MNWIHELITLKKWKKYSQAHEECYLEHILKNIKSVNKFILELGAWDGYVLSNTRYFIEQGYSALLIDGDNRGNDEVKQHFITKENIVELLEKYECPIEFDLFCIDLDGNDLYIIEEVLKKYKPSVIIAEYNPKWMATEHKVITYNPEHKWSNDDYYGFSFSSGIAMSKKNGYTCIFENDSLNMYFVKNDILAISLGVSEEDLGVIVPIPQYKQAIVHPFSIKQGWIDYQ